MSDLRGFSLVLCLVLSITLLSGCSGDIKIGAVISKSGGVATPYGDRVTKGMDLALEQVNAAGGVNGGKVTLIYRDDATNPNVGTQVTNELINEVGVSAIIGAVSSPVTLAMAPICEEAGVVMLSPSSSANDITNAGDWVFRNWPADQIEGTAMAKFAKEEVGAERVVIFSETGSWGQGLADVFTSQYEGRFRKVEKRFEFNESTMDQLPAMIEEAKSLSPDACYVVAYDQELVQVLKHLDEAGIDTVRMSTSSVTADIGRRAGTSAENMVYPQVFFDLNSKDPVAGSNHPRSIRQGLSAIENFDGAAGRTSFDSNGDVVRYPRIYIVRDGQPIAYDELKDQGGSLFD